MEENRESQENNEGGEEEEEEEEEENNGGNERLEALMRLLRRGAGMRGVGEGGEEREEGGEQVVPINLPYFRADEVDEEEVNSVNEENINFDRNLPFIHSYLGETEKVDAQQRGRPLEGGSRVECLPLLALNLVLLPGEFLPLRIFDRNERMMFVDIVSQIPFKSFGMQKKLLSAKITRNIFFFLKDSCT